MDHDYRVSGIVIGCAIEVHKALGPGLKESAYAAAMREALKQSGLRFRSEPTVPVSFNRIAVGHYRPDLIVENTVVVEIKSVEQLIPLYTSQVVRYLKATQLRVGLILNFNCTSMRYGIKRVVL